MYVQTVGTGTRNWSFDPKSTGTIGAPVIVNIAKLVDVPEMQVCLSQLPRNIFPSCVLMRIRLWKYYVTDKPNARGELCLKGDNIFVRVPARKFGWYWSHCSTFTSTEWLLQE